MPKMILTEICNTSPRTHTQLSRMHSKNRSLRKINRRNLWQKTYSNQDRRPLTTRNYSAPLVKQDALKSIPSHPYTLPKSAERSSKPRFVCDSFLDIFLVLDFLLQQLGRFATCFESLLPVGHSLVDFAQHKQNITVMLEQLRTRLFRLI